MKAINLVMSIYSLINISIIVIIFFSKKRIKSFETNTYAGIIVVNLLNCIFEILSFIALNTLGYESPIYLLLMKVILCIYLAWTTIFTFYFVQISVGQAKQFEVKKIIKYALITFSVLTLIALVSPIVYIEKNGLYIPGGFGTMVVYGYSGVCDLIMLYLFIRYSRKKLNKKYIPMLLLLGLSVIVMLFQMANPEYFLITPLLVYISIIMYFTIENPDLKMREKLESAKDQADKANRAKTDFLSSMSHEIRTPLNAIVGFSDYIMSSNSLEEAKENAKDIVNASKTLLEIVNGILDISKIEAGKLEIVNSKYNAKELFEALAKLITPKMTEKGLDFTYYIAPDIPETLFGDQANIKKVVTNLLSNAYKYTEKGSVRYEVNCVNTDNISKLIITVEDTGRGIKQDKVDKLFTKFQRLDEDKNTTIEGTGLGLAITKQLTELMGGKILVHTVYGEGSKFTVILSQRIETTPVQIEKKEVKTTLDLTNKKILIVDDNELNLKVATKVLEKFNANSITTVTSGFECIEKIKANEKYDIILLDDMMPKMSGIETLKELKNIPNFTTPVIALTANAISGMKEKYLKEGFNDYLAKPLEKPELIRVMNEYLFDSQKEKFENTEVLDIIEDKL